MTNGRPNDDIESRLTYVEDMLSSARELLGLPASPDSDKPIDFEALTAALDNASEGLSKATGVPRRKFSNLDELAQEIERISANIRIFLASRGHHDPVLDYLLRREAGDIDPE